MTQGDPAQQSLEDAKRLCDTGDCDTAHEKIVNEIPPGSPLRESADFKGIQLRWAEALLQRADDEADVTKKRALLARSPAIRPSMRRAESERPTSSSSSTQRRPTPSQLPSTKDAAPDRASRARRGPSPPRHVTPYEPNTGTADNRSGPDRIADRRDRRAPAPPSGHAELDRRGQRSILEPKVFGNRATAEEIRMLKTICKSQHDEICVEKCKSLLGRNQPDQATALAEPASLATSTGSGETPCAPSRSRSRARRPWGRPSSSRS